MDDVVDFASVLRSSMARARQTIPNLAQLTGLSASTLRNWIEGKVRRPRLLRDVLLLARALELDAADTTLLLTAAEYPPLQVVQAKAQQTRDAESLALLAFWDRHHAHTPAAEQTATGAHPDGLIWLARTKLQPPQLRPDTMARPRLLAELSAALDTRRLTLLAAPAGYGKTTLLAGLPQTFPELPLAWLSLDEEDNDPARFLAALIAAMRQLDPACGAAAHARLASQPDPATAISEIIGTLINELITALPGRFALVLDDLHVLSHKAIYAALEYLLVNMPSQMRMLVATRHDPPLALARLRARGQLAELRLDTLGFTRGEMDDLLNGQFNLGLRPAEVAALAERSEGWAASLRLLASSLDRMTQADERAAFLSHLARAERATFDFLADEVLDRQEPTLRAFLLHTSILPELTPTLCAAVTGRSDAGELLERLYRRNLFLVTLGDSTSAYRYHALFAAFLRQRLAREMPGLVGELHRRAADAERLPGRAIGHYLAAEQWEPAGRLIAQVASDMLFSGQMNTLRGWIQALPEAQRAQQPRLSYLLGMCARLRGDLGEAAGLLHRALRGFDERGDSVGQGETLIQLASCAVLGGDFPRGGELLAQALERAIPVSSLVQGLMARSAMDLLWERWSQAGTDFATAVALARESGDRDALQMLVVMLHPVYSILPGGVAQIERLAPYALAQLGEQASLVHIAVDAQMALVHMARWCPTEAIAAGERVMAASATLGGMPYIDADVIAVVANANTMLGRYAEAARHFELMLQQLDRSALSVMAKPGLLYLLGRLHFEQRRLDAARGVYSQMCAIEHAGELPLAPALRAMMRGRLELVAGRPREAERALRQAVALQSGARLVRIFGNAHVLLAYLLQGQGRLREALAEIGGLLAECERDNIPALMLSEGSVAVPLLRLAVEHNTHAAFAARLLDALESAAPRLVRVPETGETLSRREVEVLRLLAAGASNRAIAEHLVLGEQTIKSHVARILRKLDVASRTQAAARARALGIE
jgi:LuxR family maltose regulon positive regulatory protein